MVLAGDVIATVSAMIKNHMLFYKHLQLAKLRHIEPKEENIVFVSKAFKKYNWSYFSSTSTREEKRRPEAPKCQPHQK